MQTRWNTERGQEIVLTLEPGRLPAMTRNGKLCHVYTVTDSQVEYTMWGLPYVMTAKVPAGVCLHLNTVTETEIHPEPWENREVLRCLDCLKEL